MFCPKCRSEFVEDIKECSDCGAPLVEKLEPEPPKEPVSRLEIATLLAIFGISYTFILKTAGTYFPQIISNVFLVRGNVILFFLASAAVFFFFLTFYREYVKKDQIKLKNGTILALIGSSILLLTRFLSLIYVFNIRKFFVTDRMLTAIEVTVPLILGICILNFFYSFLRELSEKEGKVLKKPLFFATIGAGVFAVLQALAWIKVYLFKFIFFDDLYSNKIIFIGAGIPLILFIFFTEMYFFFTFYKKQKRLN